MKQSDRNRTAGETKKAGTCRRKTKNLQMLLLKKLVENDRKKKLHVEVRLQL